jgi:hypothetical protein
LKKKNVLRMSIIVPLLIGLATTFTIVVPGLAQVDMHPAQAMWVDVDTTGAPFPNCNDITVDIYVNITDPDGGGPATGLYAWEFMLYWNNTALNCTDVTDNLPYPDWEAPNNFPAGTGLNQTYNATHGFYWRGISALPFSSPFPTPFTGVTSICTLTFHVTYDGPVQVDALIHLGGGLGSHLVMGDDQAGQIDFDPYSKDVPVIPEFPVTLIMSLIMLMTLAAVVLRKPVRP